LELTQFTLLMALNTVGETMQGDLGGFYGSARNSFTGEGIFDQGGPEAELHPQSESRSWRAMVGFLAEVLR